MINGMKRVGISICAVLLIIFTLSSCNTGKKYGEIKFPKMLAEVHGKVSVEFDLSDDSINLLGQELSVYKVITRKKDIDGKDYDSYLIATFGGKVTKVEEYDYYKRYCFSDNNCLEVYDKGSYIYYNNSGSDDAIKMADEEVYNVAQDFLEKNALLSEGFFAGDSLGGNECYTLLLDGTIRREYIMRSVGFFHEIEGYNVYGRSDTTVEVIADGIGSVYSIYSDYVFDSKVSCMSYDDIMQLDISEEGQITYDTSKLPGVAKRVVFDDVEIMYYDSPVNQPELEYIQPIYQFSGEIEDESGNKTKYYWTIPAIK